ncbi:Bumetanide-sensitive sodium-(potassium)-chloride cotransporter [Armadillidium vulgare]|nr:Bumetanide-sensitive sodium-(potassium)-chloride cotransporter [Armadillidium vulgare]
MVTTDDHDEIVNKRGCSGKERLMFGAFMMMEVSVLLPYILSTRTQWSGCKLRLFALANREDELEL